MERAAVKAKVPLVASSTDPSVTPGPAQAAEARHQSR
jgi:hypothetical protein